MTDTIASIRKCIYPHPVYQAHLSDGRTLRMSFWSPAGRPVDVARGRRLIESVIRDAWEPVKPEDAREGDRWSRRRGHWRPKYPGCRIVAGAVEDKRFPERPYIADDFRDPKPRAKPVPAAAWRQLMARVLDGDQAARAEAEQLLAA